ncbi:MAG: TfoX/Sxy family DNA transformation protein [Candidatus Izemoplasmatales bacterium]|nr:TfoX/Sxy family DNA transformation protein [Candidatus Izemoplasmatales bacterium]
MNELKERPNIGPLIHKQLLEIGVTTFIELQNLGATGAWEKIYHIDPSSCINKLLALEGAIRGIPKKDIDTLSKDDLRQFVRHIKQHKKNL